MKKVSQTVQVGSTPALAFWIAIIARLLRRSPRKVQSPGNTRPRKTVMNKRDAIEELIEQMSWYGFKDSETKNGVVKIARELYHNISMAHPDFAPEEILDY